MTENLSSETSDEKPVDTSTLSRKQAIKKILIGSTAIFAIQKGVVKAVDNPERGVPKHASEHKSEYELNGCKIHVLAIEHDRFSANNSYIDEYVSPFNGVLVPEYFPPEYVDNGNSISRLIARYYKSANSLFDYFTTMCRREGKDVLVLDPAWSNQFAAASSLLASPIYIASVYEASAAVNAIDGLAEQSARESQDKQPEPMSRRKFLLSSTKILAATGMLVALGPLVEAEVDPFLGADLAGVSFGKLDDDIRYVLVAHKLSDLSLQEKINDIMLIYPPVHWEGIRFYLDNPDQREKRLQTYKKILPEQVFPDLYAIRKYRFSQGKMIQEQI